MQPFCVPQPMTLVYRDSRDLCRRERVQNILHLFFSDNRFYFFSYHFTPYFKEYPLIETVGRTDKRIPRVLQRQTDFFIVFFRSEFRKQTDDSLADQRSGDGYCDGHQNSRNLNRKGWKSPKIRPSQRATGLMELSAKIPVVIPPQIPPIPWQPKASEHHHNRTFSLKQPLRNSRSG